jgi:hypothetical protein
MDTVMRRGAIKNGSIHIYLGELCAEVRNTHLAKLPVNFSIGLVGDVALAPLTVTDEDIFNADRLEHTDRHAAGEGTLVLMEYILST